MKKSEAKQMNEIIKFAKFAMAQCHRVTAAIHKDGPAVDADGNLFYRIQGRRDPVAIVVPNWPMNVGACVDDESERIAKARKAGCRMHFGEAPSAFIYAKFEDFLARLQNAHDDCFNMVSMDDGDLVRAQVEEFCFRVREMVVQFRSEISAAQFALIQGH
jgi:hypothetical protein